MFGHGGSPLGQRGQIAKANTLYQCPKFGMLPQRHGNRFALPRAIQSGQQSQFFQFEMRRKARPAFKQVGTLRPSISSVRICLIGARTARQHQCFLMLAGKAFECFSSFHVHLPN